MKNKKLIIFIIIVIALVGLFLLQNPILKMLNNPQPSIIPIAVNQSWKMFKSDNFDFEFSYPSSLQPKEYLDKVNNYKRIDLIDDPNKLLIQDASVCDINPEEKHYSLSVFTKKADFDLGSRLYGTEKIYSFKIDGHEALRQKNLVEIDNDDTYITVFTCKYSIEMDQILSTFKFTN